MSGEWLFVRNASPEGKLVIHFDSLIELDGKLYASHSNYGTNPMTSSVEIGDGDKTQHIGTHSFGVNRGAFTWLDRHKGHWWGAFANYDKESKQAIRRDQKCKNRENG